MTFPFVSPRAEKRDRSPPSRAQDIGSAEYLAMRCEEESYRSHRYGRPLALIVAELASPDPVMETELQNWLRASVRMSDIAAHLEDGVYALLLPETGGSQARGLLTRLCVAFPRLKAGIASYPEDGATLDLLVAAARANT